MFVTSLPGLSSSHLVAAEAPAAPALGIDPAIFAIVLVGITTIIGVVAVLGGTGGGVIFTPLLMGFTPINSYIIRATGLFVALSGSLIAARPFLRKGLANMKLLLFAAVPYTIFAVTGAARPNTPMGATQRIQ